MGLDMYLEKYPRYKGATIRDVRIAEDYHDWQNRSDKYKDSTFAQYTGRDENCINPDYLSHYLPMVTTKYWDWDEEHQYPHSGIVEQVGYWRKANHIHNWFVEKVCNGDYENCDYTREVSEHDLRNLIADCEKVLNNAVMAKGKVCNGKRLGKDGNWERIEADGLVVINPDICREVFPRADGFFFGSQDYDEYYIEDIRDTYEIACRVLKETDFEKYGLHYSASW